MKEDIKKGRVIPTGLLIGVVVLSLIYAMLIGIGFSHQNIDLRDTIRREGVVESVGVFERTSRRTYPIRQTHRHEIFYIQLSGTREKLELFRRGFNYDDLLENIHIGDRLTVFVKRINDDLDIVQIEKNGTIVLHRSEFERRQRVLIYGGILGLVGNVVALVWAKRRREDENETNNTH